MMIHELQPEKYGEKFSYIGVFMLFSHHDDEHETVRLEYFHSKDEVPNGFEGKYYICPKYKWGRLVNQNEIYHIKVKRYFTREFGDLPLYEQKKIVSTDFYITCNTLLINFRKRK